MFLDLFRRKKNKDITVEALSEKDKKWNRMWDLWAEGEIESPYNELMTYQSEVNNGGHHQYFLNTENNGDICKDIEILEQIKATLYWQEAVKAVFYHKDTRSRHNGVFHIVDC